MAKLTLHYLAISVRVPEKRFIHDEIMKRIQNLDSISTVNSIVIIQLIIVL